MRRDPPHWRYGWLLVGLLGAAMSTGAVEPESPSETARDAVGILVDNQDRCLKLSYGRLDILEADYGADKQTAETRHYLEYQNLATVRVAGKALNLARLLARDLEGRGRDAASGSISRMLGSQEDLCSWATDPYSWDDASIYRERIREQIDQFADARSSLPSNLRLSSAERREVVRKYRQELFGTGGILSEDEISRAMDEDGSLRPEDSISDEEYQRKKKEYDEWLAEQERLEAARLRRYAERRQAMQKRLQQGPREMPKLELKLPGEQNQPTADPEAMAAWHGDYSSKIAPFKQSLSAYLKVRAPTRTLFMFNACLELARAAGKVLEDPKALAAPDPQAGKSLREAVGHFKVAADACVNNRLKTTRDSIAAGERSLREVMKALKPYGLGL